MSINRSIHVTRRSAARLLDEPNLAGTNSVGHVLAAAAGPASETELAGEHAAATMFRAATLAPALAPRRPSMIKAAIANLLAAKVLTAGALAAAATGGIALAAANGALPNPLGHVHSNVTPAPASSRSHTDPGSPNSSSHGQPTGSDSTSAPRSADASPSPSLSGLCKAYQAGATSNPGNAMQNPAFTVLVTAAGGAGNVNAYCVNLIGVPSTHPSGAPSSHPSGAPSTHPTGPPSTHPAGH